MAQTIAQKLGVKPGTCVRVAGPAAETARRHLDSLPEGAALAPGGTADIILFYAGSLEDVAAGAPALANDVAPGGRLWIAYRKGATRQPVEGSEPLHRDTLQRVLGEHGLQGVSLIALDDTWSAMRVKRDV